MTHSLDCSMYRYARSGTEGLPHVPLVQFGTTCLDATTFWRQVAHFAAFLHDGGLRAGQVVTLLTPNILSGVVALYAANYVGAIVSVVHPFSPSGAVIGQMRTTHSDWLLCWDRVYRADRADWGEVPHVVPLHAHTFLAGVDRLATRLVMGSRSSSLSNVLCYDEHGDYPTLAPHEGKGDDVAMYLPSGGTTGVPKTIVVRDRTLNASAHATVQLSHPLLPEEDAMLMILPIFHGFGIGVCLHSALSAGVRLVLMPRFDPKRTVRCLQREGITHLAGVPTMYDKLVRTGRLGQGTHLKAAYCGGDVLSPQTKAEFDEAMRRSGSECRLYQGYGLTETVAVCCANSPVTGDVPNSIGRPTWGTQMCVCDAVGTPLNAGETGELCVSGRLVMDGYLEGTPPQVLQRVGDRLWLHTGDLGYFDKEGVYHFTGRQKRLSVIAGINVYHQQLEQLALGVVGVEQAAAVECRADGKPYVRLCVVCRPNMDVDAALRRTLRAHLTRYAFPRDIRYVTQIPLTPLGKVDYAALQDLS